ncbi:MBG domain-containing protein [Rathayibacter oskolensis]|uniref:MBG domain-containing protein n=1 Tax=Rathayibacter oskolensis TaxID=1891671 RepID=UPI002660229A|nr:MBG domain-containing protein [Rathayibacter oskolensis]WKK70398.1 MBG domain-containing protein [Rathayibacter oskolensis]
MVAGSEPPVVTPEHSPLIDSDTLASLGLDPVCTVDVTPETPPGVYPEAVQCRGFEHPDYEVHFVDGTLTVVADDGAPLGSGTGSGTGAGPASDVPDESTDGSSAGAGERSTRGDGLAATGVNGLPSLALLGALALAGGSWLRAAGRRTRRPGRSS